MGVMLFPLGITTPVASATPTALTPAGSALLARAVTYDPGSGEVFQADPTASTLRVYRPDGHGGYTQTQSVPVGAGPVSAVFDPVSGHVLTADQRAGTVTTLARSGDGSWGSLGLDPGRVRPGGGGGRARQRDRARRQHAGSYGAGQTATLTPHTTPTRSGSPLTSAGGAGAGKSTYPTTRGSSSTGAGAGAGREGDLPQLGRLPVDRSGGGEGDLPVGGVDPDRVGAVVVVGLHRLHR